LLDTASKIHFPKEMLEDTLRTLNQASGRTDLSRLSTAASSSKDAHESRQTPMRRRPERGFGQAGKEESSTAPQRPGPSDVSSSSLGSAVVAAGSQRNRSGRANNSGAAPRGAEQHVQSQIQHGVGGGSSRARGSSRSRLRSRVSGSSTPASLEAVMPVVGNRECSPDDFWPHCKGIEDLRINDEVTGRVIGKNRGNGIWFNIGGDRHALMPVRLFSRNQPDFEVGDIVEGLRVAEIDLTVGRVMLSGVGVVFTAPDDGYGER